MRQTEALAILNAARTCPGTGAPGAGKTAFLNEFIRQARGRRLCVAVTGNHRHRPPHISTGQTIHSWSGVGVATALSASLLKLIKSRRKRARFRRRTSSSSTRFPCCTLLGCSTCIDQVFRREVRRDPRLLVASVLSVRRLSNRRRFRRPGATATSSPPRPNSSPVANGMPVPA